MARHEHGKALFSSLRGILLLASGLGLTWSPPTLSADQISDAWRMLHAGRYAEAEEKFVALQKTHPVEALLGRAACHVETGRRQEAARLLAGATLTESSAAILASRAELAFSAGDYAACGKYTDESLKVDAGNLQARWLRAELWRVSGKVKQATQAYAWFAAVSAKRRRALAVAETVWLGNGLAQHARWSRRQEVFFQLINEVYPRAIKAAPNQSAAHLAMARLYLEKNNHRDATTAVQSALALNPLSSDVHTIRAETALRVFDIRQAERSLNQALRINAQNVRALQVQADLYLTRRELLRARAVLQKAVALNPVGEETLGRLAAVSMVLDGEADAAPPAADGRAAKTIAAVETRNRKCGRFYRALAESLDRLRKYPTAARFYQAAARRLPQLLGVNGQLGLMYMRLGDEAKARPLLEGSFRVDPFHVRVKNSLEVLDVLDGYAVLETKHFVIRFDRGQDELLARHAAEYLEREVYPDVVRRLKFEPAGKSLFEFFSRAKNTSGHGWFSARVAGLPNIGTVGACAGKVVALASPTSLPRPYNWARVLKHEFVHVVNLQQTDFNIPHWYTEGLAVWMEDSPRPPQFVDVLVRRTASRTLFDLDTIDLGFIRPKRAGDRLLAYCQAELYVQYMLQRFGPQANHKMLAAYRKTPSTKEAIRSCFGQSQAAFEAGYRQYVEQLVAELGRTDQSQPGPFLRLATAVRKKPQDAEARARLALAYLQRQDKAKALQQARKAIQLAGRDSQPLAHYVLARLEVAGGDSSAAMKRLEGALRLARPQRNVLELLAALQYRAQNYAAAERLYQLGENQFADKYRWKQAQARVYLRSKDDTKLKQTLAELAELASDDVLSRRKLAEMALQSQQWAVAESWANRILRINVRDGDAYGLLAKAQAARKQYDRAIENAKLAHQLQPINSEWPLLLARNYLATKKPALAKLALTRLLERDPENAAARVLLENLKK